MSLFIHWPFVRNKHYRVKNIFACNLVLNGSKILAFREPFWSLFAENFFDCVKIFVCVKLTWSRKKSFAENLAFWKFFWSSKFLCKNFFGSRKLHCFWNSLLEIHGNFPQLWKISTTVEKFLVCWKVSLLWKSSLIVVKFLDQGKFPWLWKTYFLDCRKNNRSNNFETIKILIF